MPHPSRPPAPSHAGPQDDLELLGRIADGCEESFRVFFRRWSPPLRGFLLRATRSGAVTDELLQEAFLRIFRAAPDYEPTGEIRAWIYRIAANLAYSHWRRERRSPLDRERDPATVAPVPTPDAESPENRYSRGRFVADTRAAVDRLPPNQRLVFLLKVDRGLTYEEIATTLRCPAGTAKSRFHHAVRRLREDLKTWTDTGPSLPDPGAESDSAADRIDNTV